jgi:hypothetical protein
MSVEIQWSGWKVTTASLALLVAGTVCAAQAPQKPVGSASMGNSLQQSSRWETDDVVRQSMERIRLAMAACQERIGSNQLSAQDYQGLAQAIDENIANMVKHRKISKEVEKAFHLVVMIDLDHSLQLMRTGSKTPLQRAGAFGVLQALRNYSAYFLPPGAAPHASQAVKKTLL